MTHSMLILGMAVLSVSSGRFARGTVGSSLIFVKRLRILEAKPGAHLQLPDYALLTRDGFADCGSRSSPILSDNRKVMADK